MEPKARPHEGPGRALASGLYRDVVAGLVGVRHAAGLVGEGSEVLGFDDDRSVDHSWGPRLHVFVGAADVEETTRRIDAGLPETYRSYPVEFYAWRDQRVRHHVAVCTVEQWARVELGQPLPVGPPDWLGLPQQRLLQVVGGVVFHDGPGELTALRERLAYYPDDVWWWVQASQWQLVAKAEALPGRLAEVGDRTGARIASADLVRLLVELTLIQHRRYLPYRKWLGSAFGRLGAAQQLSPLLDRLLAADQPRDRESAMVAALDAVASQHNQLDPRSVLDPSCAPFVVGIDGARRPYRVLNAARFADACLARVSDPHLRRLLPVGAVDQLTHGSDQLVNFSRWPDRLTTVYSELLRAVGPDA